ncbi:MAG: T9SS type A sorting domain-containing protein [Chitinophagales bacterium]
MQKIVGALTLLLCTHNLVEAQYCEDDRFTQAAYFTEEEIVVDTNILYGMATNWWQNIFLPTSNSFDIAYPDMAIDPMEKRPLVFLAHGGGFWGGDKENLRDMMISLARSGYIAVSANYRRGWDSYGEPELCAGDGESMAKAIYRGMQDVQACMRYLVHFAEDYHIDTARIFMGGESAGSYAILNSMFISQNDWDIMYPGHFTELGGLYASANNFDDTWNVLGYMNLAGGIMDTAYMVGDAVRPMLNMCGVVDSIVPAFSGNFLDCPDYAYIMGSMAINEFLLNNGVCSNLHRRFAVGHLPFEDAYTIGQFACFMKSILCDDCTDYVYDYHVADCTMAPLDTTGEETTVLDSGLDEEMYPNPADSYLHVDVEAPADATPIIYTAGGALVQTAVNRVAGGFVISTAKLPQGTYFLRIGNVGQGAFLVVH